MTGQALRQWTVRGDGGQWHVDVTGNGRTITIRTFPTQEEAIALASAANARELELAPPTPRPETLGRTMARLRRETGATPILGRDGRPYVVHHRNGRG